MPCFCSLMPYRRLIVFEDSVAFLLWTKAAVELAVFPVPSFKFPCRLLCSFLCLFMDPQHSAPFPCDAGSDPWPDACWVSVWPWATLLASVDGFLLSILKYKNSHFISVILLFLNYSGVFFLNFPSSCILFLYLEFKSKSSVPEILFCSPQWLCLLNSIFIYLFLLLWLSPC